MSNAVIIAGVAGAAALGVLLGGIVGANIGGNWYTSFSFAGQRGYEATGLIGAVVGGVALSIVGAWLALRRRRTPYGVSTAPERHARSNSAPVISKSPQSSSES
ncbi:hypothetical protein [Krasilnikovia sp. MM14-A1259]|uniref:hypothetical protein n=1 Tax=Krasilnikovia sp. MM14-A1259 TaxID=3373539 RepID=UPI00399C7711